mmetsp:Transcript_4974/g.18614  ORF Transcript_4974/g.18614 Transcript_4974/m.18614 type:complete len:270 (-) Transcript_4974:1348-2157(-)
MRRLVDDDEAGHHMQHLHSQVVGLDPVCETDSKIDALALRTLHACRATAECSEGNLACGALVAPECHLLGFAIQQQDPPTLVEAATGTAKATAAAADAAAAVANTHHLSPRRLQHRLCYLRLRAVHESEAGKPNVVHDPGGRVSDHRQGFAGAGTGAEDELQARERGFRSVQRHPHDDLPARGRAPILQCQALRPQPKAIHRDAQEQVPVEGHEVHRLTPSGLDQNTPCTHALPPIFHRDLELQWHRQRRQQPDRRPQPDGVLRHGAAA